MRKIVIVAGTRPEIIKLAPVYRILKSIDQITTLWIATGQHEQLATQALSIFKISPDLTLHTMRPGQHLNQLLASLLDQLSTTLQNTSPDIVVVQGDTTSALAATVAAFQLKIPVAHVEAGLRTNNLTSPFPEEANRQLISRLATLHFCPTPLSAKNLTAEGITQNIHITGNTVVDALEFLKLSLSGSETSVDDLLAEHVNNKQMLLVTAHRRENFDARLENLCQALLSLHRQMPELQTVLPIHLNPQVRNLVLSRLSKCANIHLLEPVEYPALLKLLQAATVVATDSGGLQEEAPSFNKYVIVLRDTTERPELLEAKLGELCPLDDPENLVRKIINRLQGQSPTATLNPFGDGKSSERIATVLQQTLFGTEEPLSSRP